MSLFACRCRHSGHRTLNHRRDALDVRDELGVQSHVEAVGSHCSSGIVDGLDDHTKDRESGSFDGWRLWGLAREVTASMVEAWACAVFNTGRTLVSTNLATFTVWLAATAKARSTLEFNVLIASAFSPVYRPGQWPCSGKAK